VRRICHLEGPGPNSIVGSRRAERHTCDNAVTAWLVKRPAALKRAGAEGAWRPRFSRRQACVPAHRM